MTTTQTPLLVLDEDPVEAQQLDVLAGEADRAAGVSAAVAVDAGDETAADVYHREAAAVAAAVLRAKLDAVKTRRGIYRDLSRKRGRVTGEELRVLEHHIAKADADLDNNFVGRAKSAAALGLKLSTYDKHMQGLRRKGYLFAVEFRRHDGTQSSSGKRFALPAGVLGPGEPAWTHTPVFQRHKNVVRRRTARGRGT